MNYPWQLITIDKIAEITDFVANGSFASLRENVKYIHEPNYAVLVRLADFNNGWNGNYVYVDEHAYSFLRKSALNPGEIVVCNVGSVGVAFRVPDLGQPMTLGPNSILVRTEQDEDFLYFFLNSDEAQRQIKAISSHTTLPKFNKTEFKKI